VFKDGMLARVPIGQRGLREIVEGIKCADWAPDGTIAVIRFDGPREWVEYPPGRKIFEEPANLHSCMRVSPDGQLIAMIQQERTADPQEWLTIIDRDGRVRARSQGRKRIAQDGLAWTPDGREVWFGAAATDVPFESAIRAMNLAGAERVVHRTIRSIRIEDIAPDGRALVAGDSNRIELRAIDTRTHADRDLTWITLSAPRGLSSDGRHVIFSEVATRAVAFIRPTDGGPAVLLGNGIPKALSPDGKWVLLDAPSEKKLRLVPTGAGEGRTLDVGRLQRWAGVAATWTPDGERVVLLGNEAGKQNQVFSLRVSDADLVPITPEGVRPLKPVASPDSSMILAVDAKGVIWKYPLDGKSAPVVLAGHERGDQPLAWSNQMPVRIFRIDLATARRTVWYDIPSPDAASTLPDSLVVHLSADGRTFVYSYTTHLSDLYLAEGLK
jgi:dipeptidyl aminopeptidase/acylaminoacyl peptidase